MSERVALLLVYATATRSPWKDSCRWLSHGPLLKRKTSFWQRPATLIPAGEPSRYITYRHFIMYNRHLVALLTSCTSTWCGAMVSRAKASLRQAEMSIVPRFVLVGNLPSESELLPQANLECYLQGPGRVVIYEMDGGRTMELQRRPPIVMSEPLLPLLAWNFHVSA